MSWTMSKSPGFGPRIPSDPICGHRRPIEEQDCASVPNRQRRDLLLGSLREGEAGRNRRNVSVAGQRHLPNELAFERERLPRPICTVGDVDDVSRDTLTAWTGKCIGGFGARRSGRGGLGVIAGGGVFPNRPTIRLNRPLSASNTTMRWLP